VIRTIKKTKLSKSMTSHQLEIGPEKLDIRDTLESRIKRHLTEARAKITSSSQRRFKRPRSVAVTHDGGLPK